MLTLYTIVHATSVVSLYLSIRFAAAVFVCPVSRRLSHSPAAADCVAIGLSSVLLWPAQSSPILPVPVDDGRVIVESVA